MPGDEMVPGASHPGAAIPVTDGRRKEAAIEAGETDAPAGPALVPRQGPSKPWRVVLLVALVFGSILVVHFTPLREWLSDWRSWRGKLESFGWAAPLVYVGLTALLVTLGCPRLLLCSIGGLAFGFLYGLLWSEIGTLTGCYATFLFVRWSGREFALRKWPLVERYATRLGRGGWTTVMLARLLPIYGLLTNAALALTPISHREFLLASAVGLLPEAAPAVLFGAGLGQASLARTLSYVGTALLILVAAWVAVARYRGAVTAPGRGFDRKEGADGD